MSVPYYLSPTASNIITQLVRAYGFDLFDFKSDIYFKLEQENYLPLVFERHEPHVCSLSHYYIQEGDLMSDPDVTFLINKHRSDLVNEIILCPLSITQSRLGIYREVAFLNSNRDNLHSFKPRSMKDLASFCNTWTDNIQAQQWFLSDGKPNPNITRTR